MKANCEVCFCYGQLFHADGTRICLSCLRVYSYERAKKITDQLLEEHRKLLKCVEHYSSEPNGEEAEKCLSSLWQ